MVDLKGTSEKLKNLSVDDFLIGLLYLFVALLPLTFLGTIEVGFTIKLSEVVAFITFSLWILIKLKRRDFSFQRTPLDIFLIGFLIVTALSLTQAVNLERGIAWWLWLAFYVFAVYYLIVNLVTKESVLRNLLRVYVLTATAVALFGLYQFFGDYLTLPYTFLQSGYSKFMSLGYPRPHATLKEPLLLGHYLLAPIIFLALSFLSKKTLFFKPWIEGILILLFTSLTIATLSRGATVALSGALVLLALGYLGFRILRGREFGEIFAPVKRRFWILVIIFALSFPTFLGMTKLGLYLEEVWQRSTEVIDEKRVEEVAEEDRLSVEDPRYVHWGTAWEMFKKNPVLGVGWGNFGPVLRGTYEGITGLGGDFPIVNNEPLEVAVESGIFGLIFYLGFSAVFALSMLSAIWQSVKRRLYAWTPVFAGFLLTFLALSAQFLTFSTIQIAHFWLVLGLGISSLVVFRE